MTYGPPKCDPWRVYNGDLPTYGKHVLVIHPAEGARTKARADDECIYGLSIGVTTAKEAWATFDDLRDMLHRAAHELAAGGEKAGEKVGKVDGCVDVDGCEGRAGECS